MFDGILFDLDGTLWNAVAPMCASWNATLARLCPQFPPMTPEWLAPQMGQLVPDIIARHCPALSRSECLALVEEMSAEENGYLLAHPGKLYPGVPETLAALARRAKLYIVSNAHTGYIETFLAAAHLEPLFSGWECAGNTGLPKAENIALVVRREGLRRPVYVGDTATDQAAAAQAGIPFLHAAYGFGAPTLPAPAVDCFSAVPAALERMSPF